MPVNKSHKSSKILHALGNLGKISKTRCSLVRRRQCLMLNLAKTQRFSEDKRSSSAVCAHSFRPFTPFIMFLWISSFAKTKEKKAVCTITKYNFRDCLQSSLFLMFMFGAHLIFSSINFKVFFPPFFSHSGCWVCLSVL